MKTTIEKVVQPAIEEEPVVEPVIVEPVQQQQVKPTRRRRIRVKAEFRAEILQSPLRGRMSGYTDGSVKRMLDPPLVVELVVENVAKLHDIHIQNLCSTSICQVALLQEDVKIPVSLLVNLDEYSESKSNNTFISNLIGSTCLPCLMVPIANAKVKKKLIFPFTDLSIRSAGRYRVQCTIYNHQSRQVSTIISNVFEIYTPTYFPGVLEPTNLSKYLYSLGVRVRNRLNPKDTNMDDGMNTSNHSEQDVL